MARGVSVSGARRIIESLAGPVSPRIRPGVVAVLAGADLFGQSLVSLQARGLAAELVPVMASILLGTGVGLGVVSNILPLLLYAYLLYALVPRVFPARLRHVTEKRGFRALAAGASLWIPFLWTVGDSAGPLFGRIGGGLVLLPLVLLGYIVAIQRSALLGRDSYVIAFTNSFLPEVDLQEGYEDDPDVRDRTWKFWLLYGLLSATALGYTYFLLLVLGFALFLFLLMYPVPELLLLGWAGYRALTTPRGPFPESRSAPQFDLEKRVLTLSGVATYGLKGVTTVLLATFGLVVPVIFLNATVQFTVQLAEIITGGLGGAMTTRPSALVASTVGFSTVAVFGTYGVWYWLRMLSRVPHFHASWLAHLNRDVETPPERDFGPLLVRPPGLFIPPAVLVGILAVMTTLPDWSSTPHIPTTYLLVWLSALVATAWSTYRGFAGDPQPASSDGLALPVSFLVQVGGVWWWIDVVSGSGLLVALLTGDIPLQRFLTVTIRSGGVPMQLTILVLYAYAAADVLDHHETEGWRSMAYVPYLLVPAAAFVTMGVLLSGIPELWGIVAGLILVSLTVALGLEDLGVIG